MLGTVKQTSAMQAQLCSRPGSQSRSYTSAMGVRWDFSCLFDDAESAVYCPSEVDLDLGSGIDMGVYFMMLMLLLPTHSGPWSPSSS